MHNGLVDPALIVAFILGMALAALTRAFEWHRYSRGHFTAQFAIRERGFFVSRTPDGTWWALRLRKRRCGSVPPSDCGDPPPDGGVREPRRPLPSGPFRSVGSLLSRDSR
jgi:hypothetical protein